MDPAADLLWKQYRLKRTVELEDQLVRQYFDLASVLNPNQVLPCIVTLARCQPPSFLWIGDDSGPNIR